MQHFLENQLFNLVNLHVKTHFQTPLLACRITNFSFKSHDQGRAPEGQKPEYALFFTFEVHFGISVLV